MSPSPNETAPYGSWSSPVTAASLTADVVGLSEPQLDGADVYWLESRPREAGRVVVVRRSPDGQLHDVTQPPFNVRSRVHEYGGGAFSVRDRVVVFCSFDDRRVYRVEIAADGSVTEPRAITPAGDLRYGDLRVLPGGREVVAVCEDHGTGATEPVNRLVRLDATGDNSAGGQVLVEGHDFFSSPAVSPDGSRFAWVQWDHPNMPWDDSELCVAELDAAGRLGGARVVAGGPGESVGQPTWAPDGRLVFISDRSGWWNLYSADVSHGAAASEPTALWAETADFAGPQWMLATASYGISDSGLILCTRFVDGYARLSTVDLVTGRIRELDSDAVDVDAITVDGDVAVLSLGYPDRPDELVRLMLGGEVAAMAEAELLRAAAPAGLDPAYVSVAEPVTWPNVDGELVHGFYYRPRNPDYSAGLDELPPLLVNSHGGPTGMSTPSFQLGLQFWTSRGFAVLHVNYGGSSGYGRAYRERLRGAWGIVDVDDCVSGAAAMASRQLADPGRLAIRGGSAGGYTTLAALTFRDVFAAGASLFGIGDLETLVADTHKFESRYCDRLIGPYPEARDVYLARSPVHHVDQITCPMILLQGAEDPVVPPNQAEAMAAAVRAKGLPVALVLFAGEGHGFRRSENVIRAAEAEAYFYSRVFGFDLADQVDPVPIENLP